MSGFWLMAGHLPGPRDSAMWRQDKLGEFGVFGWFGSKKRREVAANVTVPPRGTAPVPDGYRVFTREFDREILARNLRAELELATPDLAGRLTEIRAKLEEPPFNPAQVAERASRFRARWRAGHPLGRRPLVTILADHSGSLRERPSQVVASVLIAISEALESERIDFEVLGFTTSSWQGGESRRKWLKQNKKPTYPGRLCDLLHIVYRDAVAPAADWAQDIVLVTANEVLKENIDGEALIWAAERAERFAPTTWICLCVTDGAPVDDATILANGGEPSGWYLQRHLDEVIRRLEADDGKRLGCLSLAPIEEGEISQPYRVVLESGLRAYESPVLVFDVLEELVWPKTDHRESDTKEPA